ncbi:MAG: glycosyltransferase family 39 protein [Anaerolineales bacterium]|nr:glycosyltransferase family 39 protein [Anaerolineales bacterium]
MADAPGFNARYRWLTVLLLLGGWALRLHALGAKSLWYDELRQVEVAQRPLSQMSDLLIIHAARPLDYGLTHFWLAGLGPVDTANSRAEFWLRYPAALWGLLALAAFLPLARRWLRPIGRHPAAPLAALALFALAPPAVQYSQELRPYALFLLLAVLSAYALDRAWTLGRTRDWFTLGALAVLGALTHFFFALFVAAQGVFVAVAVVAAAVRRQPRWGDLLRFGLGAAAGGAALFVAARPAHLVLFAEQFLGALAEAPVAGLVSDTGLSVPVTTVVNADFIFNGVLPFFGGGVGWALAPFLALAALGLAAWARQSPARAAWGALWLLLAPALVIVYLQFRQQFFALRYILFALPIYLLLVSAGLVTLAKWLERRINVRANAAALLLGVLGLGLLQFGEVRHDYGVPKDDWRRVGAFLIANVRPGDMLGAPDVQAFIRFYAPDQPAVIVDSSERGPHEQALANGERFWFVWSDYTLAPVDATRAWVSALPSVTIDLDPRIRVVFIHPGRTQAEMLAEAQGFVIPPPTRP